MDTDDYHFRLLTSAPALHTLALVLSLCARLYRSAFPVCNFRVSSYGLFPT